METDTTIPDQLTWIWDKHVRNLFLEPEDEETKTLKAFYGCRDRLRGTAWGQVAARAIHTAKEPSLTRSMEPGRRFLGKLIQSLPEPFKLPSGLVAKVLGVTRSQASKVVKWWEGYGLIEAVGETKPGQLKSYRRKLLK